MASKDKQLEFEIEKFRAEHGLREKELLQKTNENDKAIALEREKMSVERSKNWWQTTISWLAPTLTAFAAVMTVILTNAQREKERIAADSARVVEMTAQREANEEDRKARLDELTLDRETKLIIQATKDVDLEQARENVLFLARLNYLSKSAEEIEKIFDEGLGIRTSSIPTSFEPVGSFLDEPNQRFDPRKSVGLILHARRYTEAEILKGRRVTVSKYQLFNDGKPVEGISGFMLEPRGVGDNTSLGRNRRAPLEIGKYQITTHLGIKFSTLGFIKSQQPAVKPKPALGLKDTGDRSAIVIGPAVRAIGASGIFFIVDKGALNGNFSYIANYEKTVELIASIKSILGNKFPKQNGEPIPAFFVLDRISNTPTE